MYKNDIYFTGGLNNSDIESDDNLYLYKININDYDEHRIVVDSFCYSLNIIKNYAIYEVYNEEEGRIVYKWLLLD